MDCWGVWSLLEELLMPLAGRQISNSKAGALSRIQTPAPESDSMAGGLRRGIRAHVAEVGVTSLTFLGVDRTLSECQPTAMLSDPHAEGKIGSRMCGHQYQL